MIYHEVLFYVLWEQKVDRMFSILKEFLVGRALCQCTL